MDDPLGRAMISFHGTPVAVDDTRKCAVLQRQEIYTKVTAEHGDEIMGNQLPPEKVYFQDTPVARDEGIRWFVERITDERKMNATHQAVSWWQWFRAKVGVRGRRDA